MNERPTQWLTVDETKRLIAAPDNRSRQGVRDRCILQTMAETGMRKGELMALNIGSLTSHNGEPVISAITLKRRNGKKVYRTIPISSDLDALLRRYVRWEHGNSPCPDLPLFMTMGIHGVSIRQRITARAVDLIVIRYLKMAGIEKRITSHSLRHTNATRLLECGADVETVRQILGHASLSSTQRYVHSTGDRKRQALEKLGFSDGL